MGTVRTIKKESTFGACKLCLRVQIIPSARPYRNGALSQRQFFPYICRKSLSALTQETFNQPAAGVRAGRFDFTRFSPRRGNRARPENLSMPRLISPNWISAGYILSPCRFYNDRSALIYFARPRRISHNSLVNRKISPLSGAIKVLTYYWIKLFPHNSNL